MTMQEKEDRCGEFCDHFCKYSDLLNTMKEQQAKDMIRSIACDRCPLDPILKEQK